MRFSACDARHANQAIDVRTGGAFALPPQSRELVKQDLRLRPIKQCFSKSINEAKAYRGSQVRVAQSRGENLLWVTTDLDVLPVLRLKVSVNAHAANVRRLTLALSGRTPTVGTRRERTMYQGARGALVMRFHGPLERVVRGHLGTICLRRSRYALHLT